MEADATQSTAASRRKALALLRRAGALREELFDLSAELSRLGYPEDPQLAAAPLNVQAAANGMGEAERILSMAARDPEEEPPVERSQDAAIVLALTASALPFAASEIEEAECWLRVLRLHGRVGEALHALGVAEGPLQTASKPLNAPARRHEATRSVERVRAYADKLVRDRGARLMRTTDLLSAVVAVYGGAFERALYERGISRQELLDRLAAVESPSGP
jgi:hypothetical protein